MPQGQQTEQLRSDRRRLRASVDEVLGRIAEELSLGEAELHAQPVGTVTSIGRGVAQIDGLPDAGAEELLRFHGELTGIALDVGRSGAGVILLGDAGAVAAGTDVRRTGEILRVPVGEALVGRVVDPLGRPLDELGPVRTTESLAVERAAPAIMDRDPVGAPLQTGIKVLDALIPVGRGQRELILGDRQTGKSSIALDTILNQAGGDVVCVYCSIGQRSSQVATVIDTLREHGALGYSVVVVAGAEDPPGLQFVAPYAATSMAEWFTHRGRDTLVVYDDLTRHAWSYRELSLLLRRPPGREAYPGDIFFVHSRLLERSTRLRPELGGGSLTALPIAETEAQNIAAYIPTNLISITDGQIYLSPRLFRRGVLPAVDVSHSVSRVGGNAQLPAYRRLAGDLRLAYSQFEEMEAFARFSTRLDDDTRQRLERGHRVRQVLMQRDLQPVAVPEQIAALLAVTDGRLDRLELSEIGAAETMLRQRLRRHLPEPCRRIEAGEELSSEDREALTDLIDQVVESVLEARGAGAGPPGDD